MFIKQLIEVQVGNLIIDIADGDNFQGDIDMDSIYGTLSFTLPYQTLDNLSFGEAQSETTVNKLRLERDMLVRLYYKELEFDRVVQKEEMDLIFDGRINKIPLNKTKTDIPYTIECEGIISFANNRPAIINIVNTPIEQMPNLILQQGNMQIGPNNPLPTASQTDLIPEDTVTSFFGALLGIVAKSPDGETIVDNISNFKDKYGLMFLQQLSGEVSVGSFTGILLETEVEAWEFNVNDNIFALNYSNITNDFDAVLVYGSGGVVGEAIDILKVQAKGIKQDENGNYKVRTLRLERRDLFDEESCQKVAREKLLELNKNYLVSFDTKFDVQYKVGQPFTVVDNDMFSGTELWFIKKISWTISKSEFNLNITGFLNNLTTLPQDLVISNTGIADVDVLGIRSKVSGGDWQNFA